MTYDTVRDVMCTPQYCPISRGLLLNVRRLYTHTTCNKTEKPIGVEVAPAGGGVEVAEVIISPPFGSLAGFRGTRSRSHDSNAG